MDYFHAVAQRWWNRAQLIRGADKESLRQVERQIEIVIRERVVLFGIENFEQRSRRIAAIVRAELVDFVEHHHRIVHAGAANRLNDAAGHRAYIGTPMAAQLGFVANAAETDAL